MPNTNVILPSKPKVISESEKIGVYEIENLYPGYGYTLGNSLRRIIISSLPGAAITAVKIEGVAHEFSTIAGIKEDVITMLLNLKKIHFRTDIDEPQKARLKVSGIKEVTAGDIAVPGQLEIVDKKQIIAHLTSKNAELDIEMTIERGIGYAPKEVLHRDKTEIGVITLDAAFTAIKRVHYEVENMRVGDRTDFNRLRITIETDGLLSPRQALERSIEIMMNQLRAIVGFQEENYTQTEQSGTVSAKNVNAKDSTKLKIEELGLPTRLENALNKAGIKSLSGLIRK